MAFRTPMDSQRIKKTAMIPRPALVWSSLILCLVTFAWSKYTVVIRPGNCASTSCNCALTSSTICIILVFLFRFTARTSAFLLSIYVRIRAFSRVGVSLAMSLR